MSQLMPRLTDNLYAQLRALKAALKQRLHEALVEARERLTRRGLLLEGRNDD